MNRRNVLVSVGAVCAGTAGCTELSESVEEASDRLDGEPGPNRPWSELPVTVTLDTKTGDDREGFESLVLDGLSYWEEHSEEFAGYAIEYEVDPDLEDGDVVVELVETVETCEASGHDQEAVGCAPIFTGEATETATVEIKDGFSDDLTLTTIKHEIGHTLGLGHDDEPIEIMSGDPADRIPDYETRVDIHERYRDAVTRIGDGHSLYNEGQDYLGDEQWQDAVEPFEAARDEYERARDSLVTMREDALEIDAERGAALIEEAATHTRMYRDAAEAYALMAEARADGDFEEAQARQQDAQDALEDIEEYEVQTGHAPAEALGLQ